MSKNNQILIKEYKKRFYVFDVMAESWGEVKFDEKKQTYVPAGETNYLHITEAIAGFDKKEDALSFAELYEEGQWDGGSEYGIHFNHLAKDNAEVVIVEQYA